MVYSCCVACCEATLAELEKICFSFSPPDAATFQPDPAHWDGGTWAVPDSFDPLCRDYPAPECGEGSCPMCPRLLQLLARKHQAALHDALSQLFGTKASEAKRGRKPSGLACYVGARE